MKQVGVIVFPTDTVYGIACSIQDLESMERIFQIKKRPHTQPLPILFSTLESIHPYVVLTQDVIRISQYFWPGALTLIVKTTEKLKKMTGENTVAIRMPDHPDVLHLLDELGPLRTTSLNDSGQKPLSEINEIKEKYSHSVDHIYDFPDKYKSDVASTIIDMTVDPIICIRQGDLTIEHIKQKLYTQK